MRVPDLQVCRAYLCTAVFIGKKTQRLFFLDFGALAPAATTAPPRRARVSLELRDRSRGHDYGAPVMPPWPELPLP